MIERRTDTAQGVVLALLLHLALLAVIVLGRWMPEAERVEAGGIAADVVDAGALSAAVRRTLADRPDPVEPEPLPDPVEEPEPEPEPEPPAPQPEPQDVLERPDPVDQEAVVDAPTPTPATEPRVQEEKRRQEQVDLSEERRRQEQAQRLKAEREAQLAEIRRRRAAAQRDARLAEERLEQLQAGRTGSAAEESARADAAASGGGDDDGLRGRYASALQEAIRAKWTRPENIASGALCVLKIRQLPGGEVVEAQVQSPCVFDEQGRRSIEAAVLKAQPLPYAGFERVFARDVTLRFRAD